jgi:hypothetical protein
MFQRSVLPLSSGLFRMLKTRNIKTVGHFDFMTYSSQIVETIINPRNYQFIIQKHLTKQIGFLLQLKFWVWMRRNLYSLSGDMRDVYA